jgi:hypothetical protein
MVGRVFAFGFGVMEKDNGGSAIHIQPLGAAGPSMTIL